jgi:spore coat polysaccharide biosynthesis protein SpsF (cytidylyltransferase family)
VREVYQRLYPSNPAFTLADVLQLLDQQPGLAAINRHTPQKAVRI